MRLLITSDLHLTDRAEHEYRWDLFPRLREVIASEHPTVVAILGDVTDRKDNHSSTLVHRILRCFRELDCPLIFLKGNHDYIDEGEPFFDFMEGMDARWLWWSNPAYWHGDAWGDAGVIFLPHTRQPEKAWHPFSQLRPRLVLGHATVTGSQAESGFAMDGIQRDWLPPAPLTVLGDVHVPQQLSSDLWYVGSPYHVRYGRVNYDPRFLWVEWSEKDGPMEARIRSIPTGLARRVILDVRTPEDLNNLPVLGEADKLRVVVHQEGWPTPEAWAALSASIAARVPSDTEITPLIEADAADAESARTADNPEELFHAYCAQKAFTEDDVTAGYELLRGVIAGEHSD